MSTMKRISMIVGVLACGAGLARSQDPLSTPESPAATPSTGTAAPAAGAQAQEEPRVLSNRITLNATVADIKPEQRQLTLKGPDGETMDVQVSTAATRFSEIQKGDQVQVDYLESVALSLQKPGEAAQAPTAAGRVAVRAPGEKPAGAIVDTQTLAATVEAVDKQNRTVTLRGPEGNTRTVKVPPEMQRFDEVKPGDQIQAQYTQAVAIDVRKP